MNSKAGFTIIELMTVVAIAGILMAVALPSYEAMVKNNCLTTSVNSLVTSLQRARSEAVKRRMTVTLSANNAGDTANEWGLGWTVTINEDRNGNAALDPGEDYDDNATLDNAALVQNVNLTCTNTTIDESGNKTSFVYAADGFTAWNGRFVVCDDRSGERGRQLVISATGRPNLNPKYTCP